jgi:hypothetical protein
MISSNCGQQFTSVMWAALCKIFDIAHRLTTAYHPEVNNAVERLHCRSRMLYSTCTSCCGDLGREFPWVILGLLSQPREDSDIFPAEAIYGAPVVLPNEFLHVEEFSVDQILKKLA